MKRPSGSEQARLRLIEDNEIPPLPRGWDVQRFRFLFRESKERNGETPVGDMLSVSEYWGVVPKQYENEEQRRTDEELENYRVVRPGELAVNTMWLNHLGLGVSDHLGHVSPAYAVYEISSELNARFAHHLLRSQYYLKIFLRYLYGIRPNSFQIKADDWNSIPVIVPPRDTQRAIADFLDRETVRIDHLIEKKQRLVGLLHERSLSAIEKAVTSDASLSKLGHHVKILPGYAFASASFSDNDNDIRLLRGANVSPGKIRWDDVVYWPRDAIGGLDRFQLEAGDIVMGMDRPWISGGIRVAEITESDLPALLLQRVCKIIPLTTLSRDFLKILLSSKKFLGYFEPELTGVSVPHISGDQIAGFRFPYLPVSQQDDRARACQKVLKSNDAIIDRCARSMSGLQEFRSALITAAVTGQIDVATWGKQGQTDRRLDQIEEDMTREAARA